MGLSGRFGDNYIKFPNLGSTTDEWWFISGITSVVPKGHRIAIPRFLGR